MTSAADAPRNPRPFDQLQPHRGVGHRALRWMRATLFSSISSSLITRLLIALLALAVWRGNPWYLLAALFCGYGFAWVGHFFFEKNRPATFRHPFYSFAGDWVMFKDILTGRIPL